MPMCEVMKDRRSRREVLVTEHGPITDPGSDAMCEAVQAAVFAEQPGGWDLRLAVEDAAEEFGVDVDVLEAQVNKFLDS